MLPQPLLEPLPEKSLWVTEPLPEPLPEPIAWLEPVVHSAVHPVYVIIESDVHTILMKPVLDVTLAGMFVPEKRPSCTVFQQLESVQLKTVTKS